jgi:hypothetical protein
MIVRTLTQGVHRMHVIPLDDLKLHDADCGCWCKPSDNTDCPDVMVHHALDGREAFEEGLRRPS